MCDFFVNLIAVTDGAIAQLGERLTGSQEVRSSILLSSTKKKPLAISGFFLSLQCVFFLKGGGFAGGQMQRFVHCDLSDGYIAVVGAVAAIFTDEGAEKGGGLIIAGGIKIAHFAAGFAGDDQGLLGIHSGFRNRLPV